MIAGKSPGARLLRAAISIGITFYTGWMFMLAVGVIHHEWIHKLPTLGYWWSVIIAGLLRAAFTVVDLNADETCHLPTTPSTR